MRYLIYAPYGNDENILQDAPVAPEDSRYLRRIAEEALQPLSDEQYMQSVAGILQTFARSSYILDGGDLYWCVEWPPGLFVVRFSPSGEMAWAAVRSPVPEFGGREPLQEDIDSYDEDAENHQYNLVFTAWDAELDEQHRKWGAFQPSAAAVAAARDKALEHANVLGSHLKDRYANMTEQWAEDCKKTIAEMAGEGVRIRMT